jgi:hypothetical protein
MAKMAPMSRRAFMEVADDEAAKSKAVQPQ